MRSHVGRGPSLLQLDDSYIVDWLPFGPPSLRVCSWSAPCRPPSNPFAKPLLSWPAAQRDLMQYLFFVVYAELPGSGRHFKQVRSMPAFFRVVRALSPSHKILGRSPYQNVCTFASSASPASSHPPRIL